MICDLCPRNCSAERNDYIGKGFCRLNTKIKVARIAPHMWEEPPISGAKGSGTVFFSGCTLRCVFCQNYEISENCMGAYITEEKLADEFKRLESMDAHNINLVSPTPYVNSIIKALELYKPDIPVIYNCGGYEKAETIRKLRGYIDIYLPDFKYSDDSLAVKYSKAPDYVKIASEAISEMYSQAGESKYNENGIMEKGVIIRHLILPNHTRNSIEVLNIIKKKFPNVLVSLMGQYIPLHKANDFSKLSRKITKREYEKVENHMLELELDGFTQELNSASEIYVPVWDYNTNKKD